MNPDKNKKLRSHYYSLLELQRQLDRPTGSAISANAARPLLFQLGLLKDEFPDLVPFPVVHELDPEKSVDLNALRGWLSLAPGRLKVELDQDQPASAPVIQKRQFNFVNDPALKAIIERDYEEIQRAFVSNCWKSVIILRGGAIEAILTDLLLSNKGAAVTAKLAPKGNDITRWDFSTLIDVAVELNLVSAGVQKLSHPLREYRNLVHPGNEIRNKLNFNAEEAKIAIEVLHILHRDLMP